MTRKNEGKIALIMILALIAFVIGSAMGISVSIGENENQTAENNNTTPHYENVTVEMTSNLNKNKTVEFDSVQDSVDYNNNQTLQGKSISN